jgi:hypothetical protein
MLRKVYQQQTDKAKAEGTSNCPYCAIGHDQNAHRIWKLDEMDADHVTAWSKGGSTDITNCQMLCKTHNRSKEVKKARSKQVLSCIRIQKERDK